MNNDLYLNYLTINYQSLQLHFFSLGVGKLFLTFQPKLYNFIPW
jgi:hypothetical protein